MSVEEPRARVQRSDAQRNRRLLVTAARAVFSERGVEASVAEIVARAGVGIGTLYRHFPNREALVDALFDERMGEVVAAVERAVGCADASSALELLLEQMVMLQRGDRVFKELLTRYPPNDRLHAGLRAELERLSELLLARAREQGLLRDDFVRADLALLVWSLGPIVEATAEVAPDAWRRHLRFVLDGLAPGAASGAVVPPPLSDEELAAAMRCLRSQRFHRAGGVSKPAPG